MNLNNKITQLVTDECCSENVELETPVDLYKDVDLDSPRPGFVGVREKHIQGIKEIHAGVKSILNGLHLAYGLDLNDENFKETPERVVKMLMFERCSGINSEQQCGEMLSKTFSKTKKAELDQMIVAANPAIAYGLCPHHLQNVEYRVYMAYMPSDKVVGISKFNRVICLYAKQPMMQEDFTDGLADIFEKNLKPKGVMIVVKGKHDCMITRGAEAFHEQWIITSAVRGLFLCESTFKEEFLRICAIKE